MVRINPIKPFGRTCPPPTPPIGDGPIPPSL